MAIKPMRVDGIDISHHQGGSLNLALARKRGLKWMYHKATEGDTVTDQNYIRRRIEAKRAGIQFGAYHFARAERKDAVAEARRFISVAKPLVGDLRPALDLETTEGLSLAELRTWAAQFVAEVERLTGVKPIVYTQFDLGTAVKGCLLWRPRYNDSNTPPRLPYDIWQFSNGVFGKPDIFPGFGHVDLNYMRPGLTVADLLIPKAKPKPKPVTRVHVAVAPLEFGDSDQSHTADITAIFKRERQRNAKIVLGTEAGPGAGNTSSELERIAKAYGYRLWCPASKKRPAAQGGSTDCWVAISEDFIKGKWETGFIPAIPGSTSLYAAQGLKNPSEIRPKWGTKGLVWVGFDSVFGRVYVGAGHYLTLARDPKHAIVNGVDHWEWNRKFASIISDWAIEKGKGSALVFYGGDQNMLDSRNTQPQGDTFFGGPLTTLGDELGIYPNTGHGPIDVFATFDPDARVTAAYWTSLSDKEFPLGVDHHLSEGGIDIKAL